MNIIHKKNGALDYLTAENISCTHCFTTRLGGVSTGHLASLNLGGHRGDDPQNVLENYRILSRAIGFDLEKLVLTHQTHTDIVRAVGSGDANLFTDSHEGPECDALITNEPGVTLAVFTADCTPILFHDPVTGAVGAAHAGWKGTAADIAGKTVRAMQAQFGCRPEDIRCAIGPNIGACCFQTDEDVPRAMEAALGSKAHGCIRKAGEKYYVDLKKINALLLERAGVEHIVISGECTMCSCHLYWSHRATNGLRGSQGAFITRQEGSR